MEKQKTRNEISDDYKWDLTKVYKDDKSFYKDLELLKSKIEQLVQYEKSLFESKNNLISYMMLEEEVTELINKTATYAKRKNDEDTTNTTYQKMSQEIDDVYNLYRLKTAFFKPLLYSIDEKIIADYLKDSSLKKYSRYFKELLRYKKYTLSEEKEKLVSNFATALSSSDNVYNSLTDSDLTFPIIKDEEGKEVELTESNYSRFIRSYNRKVRKEAFEKLLNTYKKFSNTITSIYTGHINSDIAITKIKGYNSTLERYLYSDNVKTEVYHNLIKAVSSRKDVINHYFKMMQDVLDVDELHRYDTYTPLIKDLDKTYSYDDAKKIVKSALNVLGDDYQSKLEEAFNSSWIDVYNNKGKRSGAYSAGSYDTPPYILLNYEGKLDDVSTLAHELGHSMHTYYSKEANERINSDYKIFVAEVASTTNELLLNRYLLENSNDDKEKLTILNNLMNLYYATIVRQTMFAEFELYAYNLREEDKPITHEILEDKYYELCKKYFGENVIMDEEIKYEWSRIPHFYYGFYVYKYATSLAASTFISTNIIKDKNYLKKYIEFLSSGCSMDPLDELKIVDVDLSRSEVIDKAMTEFDNYITEFENLYNKIKE